MSTSTTSTIVLERERLEAALRAIISTATSQQLSTLALPQRRRHTTAAGLLDDLRLRTTAISEDSAVAGALQAASPTALPTCVDLLERGRGAAERGQTAEALSLADESDRILRRGLLDAAATVARQERAVETSIVSDALKRIGCTVTAFTGDTRTGIWAERGHQMVGVRIEDGGRTMIDIAGCDAGECTPLHHELESELARVGARLVDVTDIDHRDRRGGTLIQRAAAVADKSHMAEGIAKANLSRFATAEKRASQPARLGVV